MLCSLDHTHMSFFLFFLLLALFLSGAVWFGSVRRCNAAFQPAPHPPRCSASEADPIRRSPARWDGPSPYSFLDLDLGNSTVWMLGNTPPDAMVTDPKSLDNSSSFLTASWM